MRTACWSGWRWNDGLQIYHRLEAWKAKRAFALQHLCLILQPSDERIGEGRWEEMMEGGGERERRGEEGDVHNAIITSFVLLCQFRLQVEGRKKKKESRKINKNYFLWQTIHPASSLSFFSPMCFGRWGQVSVDLTLQSHTTTWTSSSWPPFDSLHICSV